jgi:hypothetical protein
MIAQPVPTFSERVPENAYSSVAMVALLGAVNPISQVSTASLGRLSRLGAGRSVELVGGISAVPGNRRNSP